MDSSMYKTCPYNPSHRILHLRMAKHLVKCKQAQQLVLEEALVDCVFNSTHKIPESQMQHHLKTCVDRYNLDKHVYVPETVDRTKFPVPKIEVDTDENWDDENTPAYDPEEYCKNNPVLRQKKVQSAAKRRDFRLEERLRIQRLEEMGPINTDKKVASRRSMNTETSVAAKLSRDFEEDDPYTVEKLQEQVRLGGQQIIFAHSSTPIPRVAKEDAQVEEGPWLVQNKESRKFGRGRGRNVV